MLTICKKMAFNISIIEYETMFMTQKASKIIIEDIFPVILAIGSFWNVLIIIYFVKINAKNLTKMSSYHFLIVQLAVADLIASGGVSIVANNLYDWRLGTFACSFLLDLFLKVSPSASCFILVFISYTRYRAIAHPFKSRINKKQCSLVCVAIWTVAILVHLYFFMSRRVEQFGEKLTCALNNIDVYFVINLSVGSCIEVAIAVIPGRITDILVTLQTYLVLIRKLPVNAVLMRVRYLLIALGSFCLYLNNILNIFIYAKMVPNFRRFLLKVFTFGLYDKRNS